MTSGKGDAFVNIQMEYGAERYHDRIVPAKVDCGEMTADENNLGVRRVTPRKGNRVEEGRYNEKVIVGRTEDSITIRTCRREDAMEWRHRTELPYREYKKLV